MYDYSEVQLVGDKSIRLITLLPGSWRDAIHVQLYAVPEPSEYGYEAEDNGYEALSYVWGRATRGYTIKVNEYPDFEVTDNLFNALRRLRRRFKKRTMWVDQICINQATDPKALEERASQVKMMGLIYKEALHVNVWLGESKIVTNGMLKCLLERSTNENNLDRMSSTWWNWRSKDIEFDATPWHERLWTMQEFALAREVYLCWGSARVPHVYDGRETEPVMTKKNLNQMKQKMNDIRTGTSNSRDGDIVSTFIFLVANSPTPVGCKDPLDLIYGLLSLINDEEAAEIGVDYTLTPAQLSAKATFATMRRRGNLNALCMVHSVERESGIPSWSLDFMGNKKNFGTWDDYNRLTYFSNSVPREGLEIDPTYRLLTIRGYVLDVVDEAIINYQLPRLPGDERWSDKEWKSLLMTDRSMGRMPDSRTLLEAVLKDEPDGLEALLKTSMRENCARLKLNTLQNNNVSVLLAIDYYMQGYRLVTNPGGSGPKYAFHTLSGLLGFPRFEVRSGDILVYVDGSELLIVLRRVGKERFVFRGLAWVPTVTSLQVLYPRKQAGMELVMEEFVVC